MAKEIVKQLLKNKFGSTKHHFFLRLSMQIFKWKYSTIPCQSLKRLSQWILPGMSIWISSRLDLDYKCENKISSSMLIFPPLLLLLMSNTFHFYCLPIFWECLMINSVTKVHSKVRKYSKHHCRHPLIFMLHYVWVGFHIL